jgi:hypothetical protein
MSTIAAISSDSLQENSLATALTSKTTQSAANIGTASTTSSAKALTQDSVTLHKAQASDGASSLGVPGHLVKSMTGLLQDLATGSSSSSGSQVSGPLDRLADQMTTSQNGQGSGNRINTSA